MSDPRTLAVYNSQADAYVEMMEREASDDQMIGRFIAACPEGGRVLDLGCGPGHYARRMAETGLQVEAIDASEAMVDRASRLPGVSVRLGRFEDLTTTARYDGIWAYFSLLHASRAELPAHLDRIARALKPGGVLFLGMKRGNGGGRDRLDRYYEYYQRDELESLLTDAGLTPRAHWLGQGAGLAGSVSGWIVIRADA
ncbi:Methyltransferase domain-containing protein [Cribrihabitans marinus]|uniref:Methyltransferase domain-containing protein n=1 Tax=Cribrihabitans marinus TaxID=1227549 RepID=A0A1H7DQ21_9RHOB|nr:class I SAM-dependent methyltransferase [Cribrihabitans marinus]GGH38874.1 methyltransferase [Cribrihabitans marinus]SEK00375.1 Methyltransferase domain-containing protein [Cribrihabitans marinus]